MDAVLKMAVWDSLLQRRSHLYSATLFTTLSLCLVAYLLRPYTVDLRWLSVLLFTDPAVIGLTFVGAFMFMERGAKTVSALSVTPLSGRTYVGGKILSFVGLGTISGLLVALAAAGTQLHAPLMLIALVITNLTAVLIGFCLAADVRSVNAFLVRIVVATIMSVLPIFALFGLGPEWLQWGLALVPSYSMLSLLVAGYSYETTSMVECAIHIIYLMAWSVVSWVWASRAYQRFLLHGES